MATAQTTAPKSGYTNYGATTDTTLDGDGVAAKPANLSMMQQALGEYPAYSSTFDPSTMSLANQVSGWVPLARQMQQMKRSDMVGKGAAEAGAAAAKARTDLASHGGLTGGARERVAENSQNDYMNMMQGAAHDTAQNELQIGVQDAQNIANAKNSDITNAMKENDAKNNYNMNLYQTKMQAIAADRQAQATENSGKK
jgi:hypothetical protein